VLTIFLLTSFYWGNLIHFGMRPKKWPDGILAFTLSMDDKKLPVSQLRISARLSALQASASDRREDGLALTKALGQTVRYKALPPETYHGFRFAGAEDLGDMFQLNRDFGSDFCGARNLGLSRSLNPALQTFEQWLSQNRHCILLE